MDTRDRAVSGSSVAMLQQPNPRRICRMPSAGSDPAPLRFSTDALPQRERVPFWREVFGRQVVRCDIEPARGHPFEAAAMVHALPGLRHTSFASSAARNPPPATILAHPHSPVVPLTRLPGTL